MTALPPAVAVGVSLFVAGGLTIVVMILFAHGEREQNIKRQQGNWGAE